MDYLPTLRMFLPFVASIFPNTTVRLFVDAGSKPAGVNAVAAPARTTRRRDEENMAEVQTRKQPKLQKGINKIN